MRVVELVGCLVYESMWTKRYPEEFARLDEEGRFQITQVLASGYLEGWEPEREDVEELVDLHLGVLTIEQAQERSAARACAVAEARAVGRHAAAG